MKIRYIISHGVAEWVDFDHNDKSELTLSFEPQYSGTISLGTNHLTLKSGEVTLPLDALSNGKYTPRLECEVGAVCAAGFVKRGGSVAMTEDHGRTVRAIIRNCYELECIKKDLEKRVAHLEELCNGHDIFNFERKEI